MLLTFKTETHADHRSDAGFRCIGMLTVVVRLDGGAFSPVVDIHCQKCHKVIALDIKSVESAEAREILDNASPLAGVPAPPHDGRVDNPAAPIPGAGLGGGITATVQSGTTGNPADTMTANNAGGA